MKIVVRTPSNNPTLLEMSQSFYKHLPNIEIKTYYLPDGNNFYTLYESLTYDSDITINIDSDVFLIRPNSLIEMAKQMIEERIYFAGMPESGVSGHRTKALYSEPHLISGGIIMFNNKLLKPYIMGEYEMLYYGGWTVKPESSRYERHWATFQYFNDIGLKYIGFKGCDHQDGITTKLKDSKGNYFAFHTWYGRNFTEDTNPESPNNRQRILKIYEEAKILWQK